MNLAFMYRDGLGTTLDYREAARLFGLAAEKGHPAAQNNLGLLDSEGAGSARDHKMAFHWFRRECRYSLTVMSTG